MRIHTRVEAEAFLAVNPVDKGQVASHMSGAEHCGNSSLPRIFSSRLFRLVFRGSRIASSFADQVAG